jgi:hypothetical protein
LSEKLWNFLEIRSKVCPALPAHQIFYSVFHKNALNLIKNSIFFVDLVSKPKQKQIWHDNLQLVKVILFDMFCFYNKVGLGLACQTSSTSFIWRKNPCNTHESNPEPAVVTVGCVDLYTIWVAFFKILIWNISCI